MIHRNDQNRKTLLEKPCDVSSLILEPIWLSRPCVAFTPINENIVTFYKEFLLALRWRPGVALVALYWHLMGKKVRARNWLRKNASAAPYYYDLWIDTVEQSTIVMADAPQIIASWQNVPLITVIAHLKSEQDLGWAKDIIDSLAGQGYTRWELLIVEKADMPKIGWPEGLKVKIVRDRATTPANALEIGIMQANGEYLLFLPPGALLPETALFHYVQALQDAPSTAMLYGDEDRIDDNGKRFQPWLKPLWNSEMFLAQDYLSNAVVIRSDIARSVDLRLPECAEVPVFAVILQAAYLHGRSITHVPHIVCHMPIESKDIHGTFRLALVSRLVDSSGAQTFGGLFDSIRIAWPLPTVHALVSIIIPTRDHAHLLKACVESLVKKTNYKNYEIIIVDNGSCEPETKEYFAYLLENHDIRIIQYNYEYNYSYINNYAVERSNGDYVCLLNNDTEVIDGEWLTEMMRQAVRPHIGAVGAKLLYADGSIQHAGVVIGIGEAAGHAHRNLHNNEAGYFAQAHITRHVSAVTAACLVVQKHKFEAVGGLDADNLKVAFNDVDFCLKLDQAGWQNVYVPHAVLFHHESKSRGSDFKPQQIDRYRQELGVLQERWGTKTYADPLHHPRLDKTSETYFLHL